MSKKKYTQDELLLGLGFSLTFGVLSGLAIYDEQVRSFIKNQTLHNTTVTVTNVEGIVDPPGPLIYQFWTDDFDTGELDCLNEHYSVNAMGRLTPQENTTYQAQVYQNSLFSDTCALDLLSPL